MNDTLRKGRGIIGSLSYPLSVKSGHFRLKCVETHLACHKRVFAVVDKITGQEEIVRFFLCSELQIFYSFNYLLRKETICLQICENKKNQG